MLLRGHCVLTEENRIITASGGVEGTEPHWPQLKSLSLFAGGQGGALMKDMVFSTQ